MGPDEPPPPHRSGAPSRRWSWVPVVLVGAVLALLAGGGGYLLGHASSSDDDGHGDVDVGFLQDMSFHHEQGIEIAMLALNGGPGPEVEGFALDVVRVQSRERGHMDALLDRWGVPFDPDPQRPSMGWMGMGMHAPARQMLGLATVEQMDQLAQARGQALDQLFLELMRVHHQGGLHMAEVAEGDARSAEVRELAATMARVQTSEVQDYTRALQLMGVE